MNIARDTRIATYVFSEPANFLLYYNNIRTDPSLRRFSSSFHGRCSLFLSLSPFAGENARGSRGNFPRIGKAVGTAIKR